MTSTQIIQQLKNNSILFKELLVGLSEEEYRYKSDPDKWCILEIVCHLHDEEREDFRTRTRHVLNGLSTPMKPINPPQWVIDREYLAQDFETMTKQFLKERESSIIWLSGLKFPQWDNQFEHPQLGPMTARSLLTNWLAHDYLHIKQILKVKYDYLAHESKENINYAGVWK